MLGFLRGSEGFGCLHMCPGNVPHVHRVHQSLLPGEAQVDVFVQQALIQMALEKRAAFPKNVHGSQGTCHQRATILQHLAICFQHRILCQSLALGIRKFGCALISCIFITIENWVALAVWACDFYGTGVYEVLDVTADTRLQQQLSTFRKKNMKGSLGPPNMVKVRVSDQKWHLWPELSQISLPAAGRILS